MLRASLRARRQIPILLGQGTDRPTAAIARSTCIETPSAVLVIGAIKPGPLADRILDDIRGGYLTGLAPEVSAPIRRTASDGAIELHAANLDALALVVTSPWDGARITGVRPAAVHRALAALSTRIPPRPRVDLTPISR